MKRYGFRLAVLVIALVALLVGCKKTEAEVTEPQNPLLVGYATEGVTAIDENSLQKAVEEAYAAAKEPGIGLQFQNDAYSTDGVHFTCSIGNPARNEYDMFVLMFADEDMTDQIFLSQLLRPGSKFEYITLEHPLEVGDHVVTVMFTQVETVDDVQTIRAQVPVNLNFHVLEAEE